MARKVEKKSFIFRNYGISKYIDKTCSICLHCPVCYDVTVLVVLFVMTAAGQLGAAGRYEPLALAEMQSGNNFHRLDLNGKKKKYTDCLTLPALSQHDSTEVSFDHNF